MTEKRKANNPKGQHIVPRLHLQHFAGLQPKGHVWTYDKENEGATRSAIPDETATFTHFYSLQLEDGSYDFSIEEFLGENESAAAPIYRELVAGKLPFTDESRAEFSTFLALLYLRTRASRDDAAKLIGRGVQIFRYAHAAHDDVFEGLIRRVEKERGEKIPEEIKAEVRRQLLDPSDSEIHVPKERALMGLQAVETLAPMLFQMKWTLVRPEHGFFITSDNPVVRWVPPSEVSRIYGDGGFRHKKLQVTLALTPQLMLLLTWLDDIPDSVTINRQVLNFWNTQRAIRAEQFLYSHIEHRDIKRLGARFKGSRPSVTTEGFGPEKFAPVVVPRRWKRD